MQYVSLFFKALCGLVALNFDDLSLGIQSRQLRKISSSISFSTHLFRLGLGSYSLKTNTFLSRCVQNLWLFLKRQRRQTRTPTKILFQAKQMSKTFVPLHFWPSREIPGLLDTMSSFLQPGILNPNGQPRVKKIGQDLFITLKVHTFLLHFWSCQQQREQ